MFRILAYAMRTFIELDPHAFEIIGLMTQEIRAHQEKQASQARSRQMPLPLEGEPPRRTSRPRDLHATSGMNLYFMTLGSSMNVNQSALQTVLRDAAKDSLQYAGGYLIVSDQNYADWVNIVGNSLGGGSTGAGGTSASVAIFPINVQQFVTAGTAITGDIRTLLGKYFQNLHAAAA